MMISTSHEMKFDPFLISLSYKMKESDLHMKNNEKIVPDIVQCRASDGRSWRRAFPFQGGHFGVGKFARGKGARSYEARFSPSRSPFPGTSLFCAVVWGSVLANACMLLYWWHQAEPIFFRRTEGGLRSRPVPGGCCIAGADLLLPVVLLLALICSCLLYCWC